MIYSIIKLIIDNYLLLGYYFFIEYISKLNAKENVHVQND